MMFLQSGHFETAKGIWHLGGLVFAAGAALYNVCALTQRREPHLLVNAVVYTAAAIYELEKTRHHFVNGGTGA